LESHKNHSFWLFNIYDYNDGKLSNVNDKDNYPIMIQYLYRENFEITNKLSRKEMKNFEINLPEDYNQF
jgi:hypothetical protein